MENPFDNVYVTFGKDDIDNLTKLLNYMKQNVDFYHEDQNCSITGEINYFLTRLKLINHNERIM